MAINPEPKNGDARKLAVLIDQESHAKLCELAEADRRTLGGEVEWLIDEACRARGTSPVQGVVPATG